MVNLDNLVKTFASINLPLKIMVQPLVRSAGSDIVQIDITRGIKGNTRSEIFRIYPGHESNLIQVMNSDKTIHQLVLHVKEEKRKFFMEVSAGVMKFLRKRHETLTSEIISKHVRAGKKAKFYEKYGVWGSDEETSGNSILYLMGLDERQLFIARLPTKITTVAEAHKSLKGTEVTTAEGKAPGKTIRQGEWFFIHATPTEIEEINNNIKKNLIVVRKKYSIGHNSVMPNSHVADEAVILPPEKLSHGFSVRQRPEIFVRGSVRHRDHGTVKFGSWRRVIRNAEPASAGTTSRDGMMWVD
jgi:hypothetical protein